MLDKIFYYSLLTLAYFLPGLLSFLVVKIFSVELNPVKFFKMSVLIMPFLTILVFELFFEIWSSSAMLAGLILLLPSLLLGVISTAIFYWLLASFPMEDFYNARDDLPLVMPWFYATFALCLAAVLAWRFWPYSPQRLF